MSKDHWSLNTLLYFHKYQLDQKKHVEIDYSSNAKKNYKLSEMTENDDKYNQASGCYNEYKKEKEKKIAEIMSILEDLYPNIRPKKKSRRSSGGVPPSPTGGDSSSDSD